jgi:hypothetical protein
VGACFTRGMNASRLFRAIWRVNGLLVLLAFVLAGGAAIVGATAAAIASAGDHDAPELVVARVDLAARRVTRTTRLPAP